MDEHARQLTDARNAVDRLEVRMEGRFQLVEKRFEHVDSRIYRLDETILKCTLILQVMGVFLIVLAVMLRRG